MRVQSGSTLTLTNQAKVISTQNTNTGLVADDGVGVTLVNSNISGNTMRDLQLTFGTRADLRTLTFGTYTCDRPFWCACSSTGGPANQRYRLPALSGAPEAIYQVRQAC